MSSGEKVREGLEGAKTCLKVCEEKKKGPTDKALLDITQGAIKNLIEAIEGLAEIEGVV